MKIGQCVDYHQRRLEGCDLILDPLQDRGRIHPAVLGDSGKHGVFCDCGPETDAPGIVSGINVEAPAHILQAAVHIVAVIFSAVVELHARLADCVAQPFKPCAGGDGKLHGKKRFANTAVAAHQVNGFGRYPVRY